MKMMKINALVFALLCAMASVGAAERFKSEKHAFSVELLATGLKHPWAMAFLPRGEILITERDGRLLLHEPGAGKPKEVFKFPDIRQHGQGGLLDVILDPGFSENRFIYLSYAGRTGDDYGTEVMRVRYEGGKISEREVIFRLNRKTDTKYHFGSRLLFAQDGTLFITLGDRGDRQRAQNLGDHAGSLIRIDRNGKPPGDNPWVGQSGVLPEIYTYGNRNMQGIAKHPKTGEIYTHEHGPQGGDELNLMRPGVNYGWPEITYGKEYGTGWDIGVGAERENVQHPIHYWVPSIAPSGMVFYTGDMFPEWRGDLFVGSLKFGMLVRLEFSGGKVIHEERMLNSRLGRIRDVRQGPDGAMYLLTDERNGALLRLQRSAE
ncbi:MAG: PQQ-dependent sugar dehydrogenase [Candidatus Eutrophobiaceae bacterium]